MLKSDARKIWLTRWPPRVECLKKAERKVVIGEYKNGKPKYGKEHQCAICFGWFPQEKNKRGVLVPHVEVDHVQTVGGFGSDITLWADDLRNIYSNLLVETEKLRCLCKECHAKRTKEERDER